jgi:cob(I)alamin adenosyltransferase
MAEVATAEDNRHKLVPGTSQITTAMVEGLERRIDELSDRSPMPAEFVIPGANRRAAALDVARTAVRRAERIALGEAVAGSLVTTYLNRLSDLLWTMARWQEGDQHLAARTGEPEE